MNTTIAPAPKRFGEDPSQGKIMPRPSKQAIFCTKADGYRGIWWGQTPLEEEYAFKYSGGLSTYPVQHSPFAVYRPEVNKTFFVWGGTTPESLSQIANRDARWDFGPGELLHMVSYYDHNTGLVPRPTILFDKWTADPHDNPVLAIDDEGFLWIFSPSHGLWTTPSFIHRSTAPYDINHFETVSEGLFAYPQAHRIAGRGLALFHTQYGGSSENCNGRGISFAFSPNGRKWKKPQEIAHIMQGHYQVTASFNGVLGTAFDLHPAEGGLEARTNIYYLESHNLGQSWKTVDGRSASLPIRDPRHPCLVRDYQSEGLLVYLKDMVFDHEGRPVIYYVTSRSWKPGPEGGPHEWHVARWTGTKWRFNSILTSDNNYDMGSLYLEEPNLWRIIGTSGTGPQAFNPGGEVEVWRSNDQGESWQKEKKLTDSSLVNHTHVRRPVNAHPEFYAFWADGHARRPSESRLYFTDKTGSNVWRLPLRMSTDFARPERIPLPKVAH